MGRRRDLPPNARRVVYLAAVMDLFSRRIVGWAISPNDDRTLAKAGLSDALRRRRPGPGFLHHTDRESPDTSDDYQRLLDDSGALCSMSRRGNCLDNAAMESWFGARSPQAGPGPLPVPLPTPLPTPRPASPLEASAIILELLRQGYEHRHDAIELLLTGPMRCVLDGVEATAHVEDRRAVNRSTTPLASTRKSMATAYTSSFSWSNGVAASGREGDRDRDRVRAGVSRSGFRSSRPSAVR